MALTPVEESQFRSDGKFAVRHVPTGGRYVTYRQELHPGRITLRATELRCHDNAGNEYSAEDIENAARWLLMMKLNK